MESSLADIYAMQIDLAKLYQAIERLPPFPMNLQDRKARHILRDFAGRITEELAEASDELAESYLNQSSNKPMEARESLRKFNNELGDTWSFVLEFMIFAGISPDMVYEMVKSAAAQELGEDDVSPFERLSRPFEEMYQLGDEVNRRTGMIDDPRSRFKIGKTSLEDLGGRDTSQRTLEIWSMGCWTFSMNLNKCVRALKHKAWSKTESTANEIGFFEWFGAAMLTLMQLMALVQKNPSSIVESYLIINKKNHARIEKGY